jgi:hypothetical protein
MFNNFWIETEDVRIKVKKTGSRINIFDMIELIPKRYYYVINTIRKQKNR